MLKELLSCCQAKATQVGLHWRTLTGFWLQRAESRREGLSMFWSVASFSLMEKDGSLPNGKRNYAVTVEESELKELKNMMHDDHT